MDDILSIRLATFADLASWARLRHQLWSDLTAADHQVELAADVVAGKLTGYLAMLPSGEAVAFAEVSHRDYANGARGRPVPFLEGIWVEPNRRRQGIGGQLIKAISQDLVANGFQELCSDAETDNLISHAAHHLWGFHETERVVYFRKALSP